MTHLEIFRNFKNVYPIDNDAIDCWFPNGKNSIRIRSKVYGDFIFTYQSKKVWKIESVESYLDSIKIRVEPINTKSLHPEAE